ncbi:hypothetical protein [Agriterribacter sp.]|uniref:hypothetical protein n=1 Tax=Agriterribacter sp. TaxID=2821509 RepID=UPI002CE02DC9|nr:hypothetical protein [Agriterribacter sp.]HTN06624.1 hypothetical protein [Agriterribacter sp.]
MSGILELRRGHQRPLREAAILGYAVFSLLNFSKKLLTSRYRERDKPLLNKPTDI